MRYFLPSCNFKRQFPEASAFLNAYVEQRYDIRVLGCCKELMASMEGYKDATHAGDVLDACVLRPGDTVFTICENCSLMVHEQLGHLPFAVQDRNIFELLCEDEDFPWPDHKGEAITLQDCAKAQDRPEVHEAVRKCLRRMNVDVVEMPEDMRREKSRYCGTFLLDGPKPGNVRYAPAYHRDVYPGLAAAAGDPKTFMERHKAQYRTERVAGYCNRCVTSLREAGVHVVHLMELMMEK